MIRKYLFVAILIFVQQEIYGQVIQPDLQDTAKWKTYDRSVQLENDDAHKGVSFNEAPGAGLMVLKGIDFSNGTIELDIKGSNKFQQSFVGVAFHGQERDTYDAVYFRPFNFHSDDPARIAHSVQYISMPGNDWQKLRTEYPGKYENKVNAAPSADDWFHVKINVNRNKVTVFVNGETKPSLEVEKLNSNHSGGIALWVGNNSGGSFANLVLNKQKE